MTVPVGKNAIFGFFTPKSYPQGFQYFEKKGVKGLPQMYKDTFNPFYKIGTPRVRFRGLSLSLGKNPKNGILR